MVIVSTKDTRNLAWATDSTAFGHRMLSKMGWKGGDSGLGKNQQGASTSLRAVRLGASRGIGAESDTFGEQGWQEMNAGFHGVLASLKKEHGVGTARERKKRKNEKKRKGKGERGERGDGAESGGKGSSSDEGAKSDMLRLPQNKVQAGHARKMREAKDLRSKSSADMAAILGVKAEFYQRPQEWGVAQTGATRAAVDGDTGEKKKKKSKKKAKVVKEQREVVGVSESRTDRKKRKQESGSSDVKDRKKSKRDKYKNTSKFL